jgi:ribosome-binding protein aMBF1 (putative translation factor)
MKLKFNDYEPKEVIRIIREWTGLTQKEFGASIGKSERAIQHYEAGQRRYYTETLAKIIKVHKIKITIEK